jgi:predicted ChrR family anti-sigma factor
MSRHIDQRLDDYLLGTLPKRARLEVEAHLEECRDCRERSEPLEHAMRSLCATMPAPSHGLRRLEEALEGPGRFSHFAGTLAELFDVPAEAVGALLARVDDPAAWAWGLAPGVRVLQVNAGPARQGFLCGFVLLDAGATYPAHAHGAEERTLVLEGGYRCSTGVEMWRGELDVRAAGTSHAFTALRDGHCLCAGFTKLADA